MRVVSPDQIRDYLSYRSILPIERLLDDNRASFLITIDVSSDCTWRDLPYDVL